MTQNINIFKSFVDWLQKKTPFNQVNIVLIIIIGVLSYFMYNMKSEFDTKFQDFNIKLQEQSKEIQDLKLENQSLKYQGVLLLDSYKDDPNPRWIVDATTNEVKSVNDAYERVHLRPRGYNRFNLIGTTGEHIFSKDLVDTFIENNKLVVKLGKPITFNNEIHPTTKYPIGKGNYIYAVGGIEFINFN